MNDAPLPPIDCQHLAPNITHQLPDYPTPASAPILIGLSQWDTIDAVIHLPGIPQRVYNNPIMG